MLVFPRGFDAVMNDWTSAVLKVGLVRDTSTYTPDIDHDFLDDFTTGGGVFITVASYSHQTLASAAKAWDATKDQFEYDANDVAFGSLETGQTVEASLVWREVGGDDTTPANDELLLYDDGKIDVVLAADASSGATQVFVQQLEADLASGTAVDFGGGATATLSAAASRGDRSLSISALGAAGTAGDVSAGVQTTSILPADLQNGPFNIQLHLDGLFALGMRGKPWTP